MISFMIGATESSLAEPLIADTERRLVDSAGPVWVSDVDWRPTVRPSGVGIVY